MNTHPVSSSNVDPWVLTYAMGHNSSHSLSCLPAQLWPPGALLVASCIPSTARPLSLCSLAEMLSAHLALSPCWPGFSRDPVPSVREQCQNRVPGAGCHGSQALEHKTRKRSPVYPQIPIPISASGYFYVRKPPVLYSRLSVATMYF